MIEELGMTDEEIKAIKKIMIVACGSAYHTGVTSKYVFEGLARIPVEVDVASEFRYRDPILEEGTLVVVISQSVRRQIHLQHFVSLRKEVRRFSVL